MRSASTGGRRGRLRRAGRPLGALVVVALAACSTEPTRRDGGGDLAASTTPTSRGTATTTTARLLADPLGAAIAYQLTTLDQIDAASLALFDYLYRNWHVSEFAGIRDLALDRLAGPSPTADELLLRRLLDPAAPPPEPSVAVGAAETSVLLSQALACDVRDLPADFLSRIDALGSSGGYGTTHAVLALEWLDELGCSVDGAELRRGHLVDLVATELAATPEATDLSLEQAAMLCYLGVPDRIPGDWRDRVLAAQRPDGGWAQTPAHQTSNWHATFLGIWNVLALDGPGDGRPMVAHAS